jgi:hypothetical protein
VLFGCVDVVSCRFGMMPSGIHMRLFCHDPLPFLGTESPNSYDGSAPQGVIRLLTPVRLPIHVFSSIQKSSLTLSQ